MNATTLRLRVYDPVPPLPETPESTTHAPSTPFPLRCLPPAVADMAQNICSAVGVPESLAGPATLGILSASIGMGLEVRSGPQRTSRANLYVCASAVSGSGKSETMRLAAQPLQECEREDLASYQQSTKPGAEADVEMLNVEMSKLKKLVGKDLTLEGRQELQDDLRDKIVALAEAEVQLQPPVLTVEDVTVEKLAVLLSRSGETLTSISADAGSIINNLLGRYNKNDRTDETLYLKCWTGESCKVDRQGRDAIWLVRPCLSALWFVQPDKVESLLAVESLTDGGFLQRLLICHSGCEMKELDAEGRTIGTEPFSLEIVETWNVLVRELLKTFRRAKSTVAQIVEPSMEARATFIAHYNAIVVRCNGGELRDINSFAARWTEQAWRIGLCLHAGMYGQAAGDYNLNVDTAVCATELADWFSAQQLAILAGGRADKRRERLNRLRRVLGEHGGESTLRDLARRNGFAEEEVRRLAGEFPLLLAVTKRETKGRPSEVVTLPDQPPKSAQTANGSRLMPAKAAKPAKA